MKKEYDLKKLTKRRGPVKSSATATKVAVSIRLDGAVLSTLRTEADRLGLPYQTFIGSILHRYVHHDLVDPKSADLSSLMKQAS